jgi:hypothetical protein
VEEAVWTALLCEVEADSEELNAADTAARERLPASARQQDDSV